MSAKSTYLSPFTRGGFYNQMGKKLELKESSWKNLFECIRDSKINSKGSFWATIQSLETQLEIKKDLERNN